MAQHNHSARTDIRVVEWKGVTLMRSFTHPQRGDRCDILGNYDADAPTFTVRKPDGTTTEMPNDGEWLVVGRWGETP